MKPNQIKVYCDRTSNRHGKKHPEPIVQGFVYRGDSSSNQLGHGWTDSNSSKRLRKEQAHVYAAHSLVGEERFDFDNEDHRGVAHRESWVLTCYKCGYSVSIVDEKLYPMLSRLRDLGIDSIGSSQIEEGLTNTSP